jgi:hypothetical protein
MHTRPHTWYPRHLTRRRAADGSELLHVPLEEEGLRGVLADVETMG